MKTPAFLALLFALPISLAADDFGIRILFRGFPAQAWDGSIEIPADQIAYRHGWRFEQQDKFTGKNSWQISTRPVTARKSKRSNNPLRDKLEGKKLPPQPMAHNRVVFTVLLL